MTTEKVPCDICNEWHPVLSPGAKYRISAHDCCLYVTDLVATFVGWVDWHDQPDPKTHDIPMFSVADGTFTMGEKWAMGGWTLEEVA